MDTNLIIIKDYCQKCNIEPEFIDELIEDGLLETHVVDQEEYINESQLDELERYKHMYYDLAINIAGIDAIHHMLERIINMQDEISLLRNELSFFKR